MTRDGKDSDVCALVPLRVMEGTGAPVVGTGGEGSSDVSLLQFLDFPQLNCLNEADERGIKRILNNRERNTSSAYLESDTDEQLLINIYFNQTVKVRSISIKADPATAGPKAIKLFTNKPALGFEDVEDAMEPAASQILELDEKSCRGGDSSASSLRQISECQQSSYFRFLESRWP